MIPLYGDETIEDLQLNGLRMIQGKDLFRFGEDSVLLANYVADTLKKSKEARRTIADLGCNCGSIALLLAMKLPNAMITGVEITRRAAGIFERNIGMNRLGSRVSCIHEDWNRLRGIFPPASFDCIVSNPPYTAVPSGAKKTSAKILQAGEKGDGGMDLLEPISANERNRLDRRIAREEICSSLDQLMQAGSHLLRSGGRAFFIYRSGRLVDVLESMRIHDIEPRLLRMIQPFDRKAPTAFLVMGQKSGKPGGFLVQKPLILFDRPSHYTEEVVDMYGKYPPLTKEELFKDIEVVPEFHPEGKNQ